MSSPVAEVDFADCQRSQSSTNIEHMTEMVWSDIAVVKTAPNPNRAMTLMMAALSSPYAVGAAPFPWPAPISGSWPARCRFFPPYHSFEVP